MVVDARPARNPQIADNDVGDAVRAFWKLWRLRGSCCVGCSCLYEGWRCRVSAGRAPGTGKQNGYEAR